MRPRVGHRPGRHVLVCARSDDQSEAYVMIDKAIELVVDDAHIEKMDVASKDVEHLEAASKMVDWVHEQQRVDEEQDKRIVKLSIKSCRRRVIK